MTDAKSRDQCKFLLKAAPAPPPTPVSFPTRPLIVVDARFFCGLTLIDVICQTFSPGSIILDSELLFADQ